MNSAALLTALTAALKCSGNEASPISPSLLTQYRTRGYPADPGITPALMSTKTACVMKGHEDHATAIWCFEQVLSIQDGFVRTFSHIRANEFYTAWKRLEEVEIACRFLSKHLTDEDGTLGLPFIMRVTSQIQSLYPYRVFISPAFLKHEECCSICQTPRRPRTACGHVIGGIYGGEMCHNIVTDAELLEISLVTNPVQKYSVAFADGTRHNYANVAYLAKAVVSPWDDWRVKEERRRYILPQFSGIARNDPCPCGSGRKFKKCCAEAQYEAVPHFQFSFDVAPPPNTPEFILGGVVHATDDVSVAVDGDNRTTQSPPGRADPDGRTPSSRDGVGGGISGPK